MNLQHLKVPESKEVYKRLNNGGKMSKEYRSHLKELQMPKVRTIEATSKT